jgi:SAM-dependent methyltransferase
LSGRGILRSARQRGPNARKRWERRWSHRQGADYFWFLDRPPDELVKLVEAKAFPDGGALDLGCGPGVATAYVARSFSPTVGLDIALGAVTQARELVRSKEVSASFVVAEAPVLPFREGAFALVFDRGCLQAIPKKRWNEYFRRVEDLLVPEGTFQLFCSKPMKRFPPLISYRGVRARLRWFVGRRGPQFLSHQLLGELANPGLEALVMEDFRFEPKGVAPRIMTHAIFRKRSGRPDGRAER